VRLLPVNNARDRWLTPQEADRLFAVAATPAGVDPLRVSNGMPRARSPAWKGTVWT